MQASWRNILRGVAPAVFVALSTGCAGDFPQSTFRPVTDFAVAIDDLFAMVFWWTMAILFIVEALLVYILFRFRERPDSPEPKPVHGHAGLEIAWTIIPAFIIVIIAVPTIQTIFANQRRAADDALVVEVVGHQWWWEFRYPEQGVVTANQLYLPVGRPVSLRLSSVDVIHSYWVPALGGKRDLNPVVADAEGETGRHYNQINFTIDTPGEYDGQCAEYCGLSHAIMRMRAVALPAAEFDAWIERTRALDAPAASPAPPAAGDTALAATTAPPADAAAPAASAPQAGDSIRPAPPLPVQQAGPMLGEDPLVTEGRALFTSRACIACHTVNGTTARGLLGPNLTHMGARWTVGAGALPNTPENLARWIIDPQAVKPGTLMPGTRTAAAGMPPTGLTDEQVRAIAAYLSSLK